MHIHFIARGPRCCEGPDTLSAWGAWFGVFIRQYPPPPLPIFMHAHPFRPRGAQEAARGWGGWGYLSYDSTPPLSPSSCPDVLSVLDGLRRHEGPDTLSAWGGWDIDPTIFSPPPLPILMRARPFHPRGAQDAARGWGGRGYLSDDSTPPPSLIFMLGRPFCPQRA